MTLIRPLVTSLVKSNVSSIGGGGGFPSDATLEHYYPLASNLTDSITGATGVFLRASDVNYINTSNNWLNVGNDVAAHTGEATLLQGNFTNITEWPLQPVLSDVTALTSFNPLYFNPPTLGSDSAGITAAGFEDLINSGVINGNYCRINMTDTTSSYREFTFIGSQGNTNNCSIIALVRLVSIVDSGRPPMVKAVGGDTIMFDNNDWAVIKLENATRAGLASTDVFRIRCTEGVYDVALITTVEGDNLETFIDGLGTQAVSDLQLDSSTWPVNDCWYYGEIEYEGIAGSNGVYLSSEVDASNKTRVNINSSNEVIFQKTVAGVNYQPAVTLPSINQGDIIEWGLKQSLWGMELYVAHNGIIYSDLSVTNGDNLPIAATCQVGNLAALTSPLNGYYSNVKTISGISPTFEQVRNIT